VFSTVAVMEISLALETLGDDTIVATRPMPESSARLTGVARRLDVIATRRKNREEIKCISNIKPSRVVKVKVM
jgi:hypothetical protein